MRWLATASCSHSNYERKLTPAHGNSVNLRVMFFDIIIFSLGSCNFFGLGAGNSLVNPLTLITLRLCLKQEADDEVVSGSPLPGVKVICKCLVFLRFSRDLLSKQPFLLLLKNLLNSPSNWMDQSGFQKKQLIFSGTKCLALIHFL